MPIELEMTFLVVISICGILSIVVGRAFYRRLEHRHPETWTQLGSPSLFWNQSHKTQWTVSRFLKAKGYLELGDEKLNRLALALRILGGLTLGLFFLGLFMRTFNLRADRLEQLCSKK